MTTQPLKHYDEMTIEERRERRQWRVNLFGTGSPCAECGMDGTNVTHDPPDYRVDDPYHLEIPNVPYHPFVTDAVIEVSKAALGRLIGTWELEAEIGSTLQSRAAYRTCATMLRRVRDEAVSR